MIGTIRKHSNWLWMVIIFFTVLSFVYFFTPGAGRATNRGGTADYGSIDGVHIDADDFQNATREALVAYFVGSGGQWPDTDPNAANFDLNRETYQRLFLIQKLKEHNIYEDDKAVAEEASNILRRFGRGKLIPLDEFAQRALMPRASIADFQRYIRHQLGLQQLISMVAFGAELVTPQEAEADYVREHQELATKAVFFSSSNYLSLATMPKPKALAEFYTNQMSAYRIQERVQVNYVSFDFSNYVAQVETENTNIAAEVDSDFEKLGTNYLQLGKTPELARAKMRELLVHRETSTLAQKKADEFANELFNMNPVVAGNLAALAKTNGLTVMTTAPFEESTGPSEFDGGADFAKEAFARTADEPFAEPAPGEDAVYVIAVTRRIPSEVPSLESIHDRVVADYKHVEAVSTARRAGAQFSQSVTNGLAHGKSFDTICAEAKVTPMVVPPISFETRDLPEVEDRMTLAQYQQIAFTTQIGKASDFSLTRDGGFMLYVERGLPLDKAKMAEDMPNFVRAVRQARQQQALNFWFSREAGRSLSGIPSLRQRNSSRPTGPGQS